jgi:hypothetical protein
MWSQDPLTAAVLPLNASDLADNAKSGLLVAFLVALLAQLTL